MPSRLTTQAVEKSTFPVTADFTDEDGASVIPNTLFWTLTDRYGNVINSREDVEIETPAASVTVVLSGDDLALLTSDPFDYERYMSFEGTYDSDLGSNLPLNDGVQFEIYPLPGVS